MSKISLGLILALIAGGAGAARTFGQSAASASGKNVGPSKSASQAKCAPIDEGGVPGFDYRNAVLTDLRDTGNKLVELAKAMPADKFTWRPSGGESASVSELYLLAATEYYHLPSEFGAIAAAGYEFGGDAVTGRRQQTLPLEKSITNKADVITEIVDSVAYFKNIMQTVPDADLQKTIKISGHDTTPNAALFVLATDMHEYLAQAMDYARSNGVNLPWMAELQQAKQKRGERTPYK